MATTDPTTAPAPEVTFEAATKSVKKAFAAALKMPNPANRAAVVKLLDAYAAEFKKQF